MIPHSGIPLVEWLLATAIVLVVPLGLQHGRRPPHSVVVLLIAGLGAVAALFVADPMTSALLVLPYLLATLWLAAHGGAG